MPPRRRRFVGIPPGAYPPGLLFAAVPISDLARAASRNYATLESTANWESPK
jgi:hypothetical protein